MIDIKKLLTKILDRGVFKDNTNNVAIDGNLTLLGHSSEVGDRITVTGSATTSNVPQSANAYVTIGSINLPAGMWVVVLRARFVPASGTTGNSYPAIYFTTSSTGEGWHSRTMVASTTNAQLTMTSFANPSDTTQDTPYYLRGYSNTAGTWYRQNSAQFTIDAVRLV